MTQKFDSKILGAFLIGFALVSGTIVINNLNRTVVESTDTDSTALVAINQAPPRVLIPVKDSNNDGLEDWQEEFVSASKIVLSTSSEEYTPPDTVTGQLGTALMHKLLSSKVYAPFGSSPDQIVDDLVKNLSAHGSDKIYNTRDITITDDTSKEAIRVYGNALALAILNNGIEGTDSELFILQRIIHNNDAEGIERLVLLAKMYQDTRDDTIKIPVPRTFTKQHLDLINVYNALYVDVDYMSKLTEDPALSLIRIKRYEDDAKGLSLALQNIYRSLEPHTDAFSIDDPAVFFVSFSPDFNNQ